MQFVWSKPRRALILLTALVAVAATLALYLIVIAGETSRVSGRVAYVVDGNLFIKELPDGEPRQITAENNAQHPRWSSTGEWLAYNTEPPILAAGGSQAWVTNAATGEIREAGFPAVWAPQHDYFLTRVDNESLDYHIVTADGTVLHVLEQPRERGARTLSSVMWTADGEGIAYIFILGRRPDDGAEIRVRNIKSGRDEVLYTHESDTPYVYGWSSDGQFLFFIVDETSKILSLDTREVVDTGKEIGIASRGSQQPDGNSILAVETTANGIWQGKRIGLVEPTSGEFTYLTNPEVAAIHARWSPDGSQISYIAGPDRSGTPEPTTPQEVEALIDNRHVWIMDADGSNQRQLTTEPRYRDEDPEWTADGEHLLFVRIDLEFPDRDPSLWVLDVSTGQTTLLVERMSYPPPRLAILPEGTSFLGTVEWLYDFHN